jgi:HD-like signal output (HDOD) protein
MEQGLSRRELAALERTVGAQRARAGAVLFDVGNTDEDEFILLDGELELSGGDGIRRHVRGGDVRSRMPLARLRPRQFRAKALTPIRYLRVSNAVLERTLAEREPEGSVEVEGGYEVTELLHGEGEDAHSLFIDFAAAVAANRVSLPSLPQVAVRVRKAVAADMGARELAGIINLDAAIAAKILRTANSPLYRGEQPCSTVTDAVTRIGIESTQQVVIAFALKEVFDSKSPALKRRMRDLWRHTQTVASGAFVLARALRLRDSERAMLAGLLHDIGAVAVLAYVEKFPDIWRDPDKLERVLTELKGEAGSMLLARWGFEPALVSLPKDVDDWFRTVPTLDSCGLLQLTHFCLEGADEPPKALQSAGKSVDELQALWRQAGPSLKALQSLLDEKP